jgi:hypothetical protein
MSTYEIGLLGDVRPEEQIALTAKISAMVAEFCLEVGSEVMIRTGELFRERETHAASAVAYFGGPTHPHQVLVHRALDASLPIIPTVPPTGNFGALIPQCLQATNGLTRRADDPELTELAGALLECLGLLRRQRRVFVSYRRIESRSAAVQLHDLLSSRGFEVFLDTHDIRPGEPFQDVLWHRLCDSDVMIMLDTPTYFGSKWTRQELGRARAKEIHVLRVVWPEHKPSIHTDFAETIYLAEGDLQTAEGPIETAVADKIVLAVENLRSRSIASRYMSITGKLRAEVEKIGGSVEGVGAHRAIAVALPDGQKLWAYPTVGIPSADLLYDIEAKARRADQREMPVLVYDHIGIREEWLAHLKWLDDNISTVRAIRVTDAGWTLAAWEPRR